MNNIWLIILGVLVVGFAAFLLVPQFLPEKAPAETSAIIDVEPDVTAEEEQPAVTEPDVTAEEEQPAVPEPEADEEETETEEPLDVPVVEEEPAPVTGYSIDGTIGSTEYAHSTEIAGVEVYWANDATYLRVGLAAPGSGFVAIGFDPVRQMEGANFILGYVENGKGYFRDDFGTESTAHMADVDRGGVENIVSAAGAEWADQTILEFIIPLDSGDAMDKRLVPGNTYTVLLAYHDLMDGFTTRHSRRGTGEIQLDAVP
jgi:hypothetical protein